MEIGFHPDKSPFGGYSSGWTSGASAINKLQLPAISSESVYDALQKAKAKTKES